MAKTTRRATRGLAALDSLALHREIRRRHRLATRLTAKRDRLMARVHELDRQIQACGIGPARHTGTPRAGRSSTLAGALAGILKGKTMPVVKMPEAVKAAGYASDAKNLRTMINAALLKNTDLFRRVGRGLYTAR